MIYLAHMGDTVHLVKNSDTSKDEMKSLVKNIVQKYFWTASKFQEKQAAFWYRIA